MNSIIDQLPPEIASQIHPDRRKNETAYWAARDLLLVQFHGQWVGFADGKVIASGTSPVSVFHAAEVSGLHPFVICVGKEDAPCRIRRSTFHYDDSYPGEALPLIDAEFRWQRGMTGVLFDRLITDTGADATILPWVDCQRLHLVPGMGMQSLISGVAGGSVATLSFHVWALIDRQEYACRLQADFGGGERILGRDVLNRMDVLFRGPGGEIVINP